MKNKLATLAFATLVTSGYIPAFAEAGGAMSAEQAHEENAYTLRVKAYLWGFPLYIYSMANAEGLQGAVSD